MSLTKNTQKQKETIKIISSETSTQKKRCSNHSKKKPPTNKNSLFKCIVLSEKNNIKKNKI